MSTKGAGLQNFMGADALLKSTAQLRPSSTIHSKPVRQSPALKKDKEMTSQPP
jgi:hypothetical protein